jgi:hypothetical protein
MGGTARTESKEKKTSAKKKTTTTKTANKVKPSMIVEKPETNHFAKFAKAFAIYKGISKGVQTGINFGATIYEASSGESMRVANLKSRTNAILNPLSFMASAAQQTLLETLRVNRANQALNYQRQLTGELAFSKSLNDGTF